MSEQPAAGPLCDICDDEPAVMSQMDLADYTTVRVGLRCMGPFFAEMAAGFRNPDQAATTEQLPPELEAVVADGPSGDGAAGLARTGQAAKAATGPRPARSRTEGGTGRRKG